MHKTVCVVVITLASCITKLEHCTQEVTLLCTWVHTVRHSPSGSFVEIVEGEIYGIRSEFVLSAFSRG